MAPCAYTNAAYHMHITSYACSNASYNMHIESYACSNAPYNIHIASYDLKMIVLGKASTEKGPYVT